MQNLHGWPKYKKGPLKICKVRDNSIFCLNILISQIVRNVKFIYDNGSDDDEYAKHAWGGEIQNGRQKNL